MKPDFFPPGLKPHTHAERAAIIEKLVPLWRQKFGENLLGIAACASYARNEDCAYSDLELELFLKELPADEETCYLRVVDGLLIEVIYHTPQDFLLERTGIASHWYISASDRLVPVYNALFIDKLMQQVQAVQHSNEALVRVAAEERYELQETFAKVLNAVEQNNREGVSLLVMDAAMRVLQILALINRQPFVTFASYIAQARRFLVKPERLDDLLDILVQGGYGDLPRLREVMLAIFTGMVRIFAERGLRLYDDAFDPNLPNASPDARDEQDIRLVPVNAQNFHSCTKLPTGPDHKYVAPNVYSIAEAQFFPGTHSCCIYHQDNMVGYIMYTWDYDEANLHPFLWVDRLMIAEYQRGKGYGRVAMQQVIAEARQRGCVRVALSTKPENNKAIRFYESLGFHSTEIEDGEMVYVLQLQ